MRNPLSSVLAITNLLREEAVSSQQREYLETIDRSGEHLLSVINAVLDLAKIESGKQEAMPVSFDIVALRESRRFTNGTPLDQSTNASRLSVGDTAGLLCSLGAPAMQIECRKADDPEFDAPLL